MVIHRLVEPYVFYPTASTQRLGGGTGAGAGAGGVVDVAVVIVVLDVDVVVGVAAGAVTLNESNIVATAGASRSAWVRPT